MIYDKYDLKNKHWHLWLIEILGAAVFCGFIAALWVLLIIFHELING